MKDVFICGAGLRSCLGDGLAASVLAITNNLVVPRKVALPDDQNRPYYLMAGGDAAVLGGVGDSTWQKRAIDSVRLVIDECQGSGSLRETGFSRVAADAPSAAQAPSSSGLDGGAVYIGSSSLDRGGAHPGSDQGPPLCGFARRLAVTEGWPERPMVVNTACTSAFNALQLARCQIAAGQHSEALVLGIETFNPFALFGFESMQLLATERAEPLGMDRQGMVLGEAVAALRLTSRPSDADFAYALGVWRVLAYANVVDGTNPTGATEGALLEACQSALRESGLQRGDIDLIKLQAAGSPINDAIEISALRCVFERLPPCVSFKSVLGHTLGASCAAETALLLACLKNGVWPQLDYAVETALAAVVVSSCNPLVAAEVQTVMLIGLGFGGGHSVLILKRHLA